MNSKLATATNYVDTDLFEMVQNLADLYIAESNREKNYNVFKHFAPYTCKCGESNALFIEDTGKGLMDVWVHCGSCAEWEVQEESKFFW